jgi:PPE-SVP subfamily C-terminal region
MERGGAKGYSDPKALGSFHDFSSVRVECAALGASASLGSLSVPPSWPEADKHIEPVRPSLRASGDSVAPAVAGGRPPGLTYQEALIGMMSARRAICHDDKDDDAKPTEPN